MHILKLGVRQPHRFIARAGWMARLSRLGTLRGKPGHGVIDIPLAALSVTSAAIMTMMERMRREVAPHLLQHWHESFSPKEVENMQTLQQFTADVSTLGENPSQEEMEAFERRMAARMPAMEAASRFLADQGKQRLQNLRKQTWIAVGAMGFLILLYALKIFSAL